MQIIIVGAGNVAWHLAQALENAGHYINEVYSRDSNNAKNLVAKLYEAQVAPDLDFSNSKADLIILAVADNALKDVMSQIVFPENCVVVHTSGTQSLDKLRQLANTYSDIYVATGVFYPLQTFSKEVEITFKNVPLCIEASDEKTKELLVELAYDLSNTVYLVSSEERLILHIAAVFACNFSNHLMAISKQILEKENLEFELLKPLIQETIRKALESPDPALVQTGPASRNDTQSIHQHLEYLEDMPQLAQVYEVLTESIINQKNREE